MKQYFIYFKFYSDFFFEVLTFNLSLPRPFNLIQVRVKIGKLVHQQIVNQTLLPEKKHQLMLGTCVSTALNANREGVLVLSWIKRMRIFQNKKVVHLFPQWYIRDGKIFFCFFKLYLISFFIAYCIIHFFL